jgi:rhomboid protease GluP
MFKRQTAGSVICVSCGFLVGVKDDKCYNCGRRNPGLWGFAPVLRSLGHDLGFVPLVTAFCVLLYAVSLLLSGSAVFRGSVLSPLPPSIASLVMLGASGKIPVFTLDRWWTVLSAGWLHASLWHILLNLFWIRQIAPAVGELYGPGRMVIVYTAGSIVGFALSSVAGQVLGFLPIPVLQGGQYTVGASAPMFGLLGALVYYGRRTGSSMVGSQAWSYALGFFVFGLIMPGVDNYAHAGGFVGGYFAGRLLDPLKPERINHMLIAVVCLTLSMLSVIVSVGHWYWLTQR